MGVLQTKRVCKVCGRQTLHARNSFSSGIGCLLSILTLGLFLPIWIVIAVLESFQPWRCQVCGQGKML